MSVEEKHFDVLQNMEFEIVQVYRSTSDLIWLIQSDRPILCS